MQFLAEKSKRVCGPCNLRVTKVIDKFSNIDDFINFNSTVDNIFNLLKRVIDDNVHLNYKIDKLSSITVAAEATAPVVHIRSIINCDNNKILRLFFLVNLVLI